MKSSAHCYELVKFYADGRPARRFRYGLTEEHAQAACRAPSTRKEGEWFIGYRRMVEHRPRVRRTPSITSALIALADGEAASGYRPLPRDHHTALR